MIVRELPENASALLRRLYTGDVFLFSPSPAAERLVNDVRERLIHELGPDPRLAHSSPDFFERIGRIRKTLYLDDAYHQAARDVMEELGLEIDRVAFDPLRLRVVTHLGHENPDASAVYYPHRDTWYGHPRALITVWLPLDDLAEEETFVFFPHRFDVPVPNDSERFDYDTWVRDGWDLKIGWQGKEENVANRYPGALGSFHDLPRVGFSALRSERLLFSGSHFHQTLPQALGTTRFSLDFRFVDLLDHAEGRGAPNVDNRSRGSALPDYIQPKR